ncbi:MAG: hypothetical protein J6Q81_03615, partial [Lentisphaeria bacterium]|nr:hypothetical protein [Lentisphaeria bacterium]
MAYIFVKKSFDSEITGKKRGDETLTFKENAFATMAAAYNSKNIKWQTVDANDNPVNELVFLDNEITSRVFFPTGNVSELSSETGKMTGSLKVTADVSGGDSSNVVFSNFNKVELVNGKADTFKGGTVKESKSALQVAAAGSITVGKNSKVTTVTG